MKKAKVFGIGLSRTGTNSLNKALEILGYKACHYPESLEEIEEYDAATDIPVARDYKILDKKYPGSKFILTIREMDDWLISMNLFLKKHPPETRSRETLQMRSDVYGSLVFDERKITQAYERHLQDVKRYFKRRERDLLILNICAGEGWEKLCPFLGKPIPSRKFPRLNVLRR